MGEREKIAQIIAEHLCPQGKAHKTLYGAERMCYSRNNFADCEKVSECVDALIEANIGDVTAWKERAKKAENALKEGVKCISSSPTSGFTVNPIDVLRDSTKCITIAQRALENIVKQYWCAERGCNECEEKQGCIEGICSRYIQQAEREIEEEKGGER